jgi:hypothetical protein
LHAQIVVREFVPGNYLAGSTHRVVLENTTGRSVGVGGWLLVTRDYSMRLPPGTRIPPRGTFRIGNNPTQDRSLNLVITQNPEFLVRLYSPRIQGNYAALFDTEGRFVHGFYNSELPAVPFLPDTGSLILDDNTRIPFALPPENHPKWGYFPFAGDPAVGFERAGEEWRVIPANPNSGSLYPRLSVVDFTGRFAQGIVTLKWATQTEENVEQLVLERSTDLRNYTPLDTLQASGVVNQLTSYTYYDNTVAPNQTYYYRLHNLDIPAQRVYSQVAEVSAQEVAVEFWWEVFPTAAERSADVGIRFFSAFTQQLKIKLLDAQLAEVGLLYHDIVYAETQNLLRLAQGLPPGDYWVVATTETQRYFQRIRLGN